MLLHAFNIFRYTNHRFTGNFQVKPVLAGEGDYKSSQTNFQELSRQFPEDILTK